MTDAAVFDLDDTLGKFQINDETFFEEFKRIMRVKEVHAILEVAI